MGLNSARFKKLFKILWNPTGYVWTKNSFPHEWWEVEVAIKVTGIGRLGGDGVVSSQSNYHCYGDYQCWTWKDMNRWYK